MWFCDMRAMPRLRDCAYELASRVPAWVRGLLRLRPDWRTDGGPQPAPCRPVVIVSTDVTDSRWEWRLDPR